MAAGCTTVFRTPAADDPALAEVVRRLVAAYQPERIYLFGSVARGDPDPDNDYDLLVRSPMMRRRNAGEADWYTRPSGAPAPLPTCSSAQRPISRLAGY